MKHRDIYISQAKGSGPFQYQGHTAENDNDVIKQLLKEDVIEFGDKVLLVAPGESAGLYVTGINIEQLR